MLALYMDTCRYKCVSDFMDAFGFQWCWSPDHGVSCGSGDMEIRGDGKTARCKLPS